MAVEVITATGAVHTFNEDDVKWRIDEERQLHVYKASDSGSNDSLASYSAGRWDGIRKASETPT